MKIRTFPTRASAPFKATDPRAGPDVAAVFVVVLLAVLMAVLVVLVVVVVCVNAAARRSKKSRRVSTVQAGGALVAHTERRW